MGEKYWGEKPWDVYAKMKQQGTDFIEIQNTNPFVSNKKEFEISGYNPQPGDICVMWTTDRKSYHTCAYDGQKWMSDFVQNTCNVYRGKNPCTLEFHIFRHN